MLHEFLSANRTDLIDRCRAKSVLRPARESVDPSLLHGIPQFLDQLIKTLRVEQTSPKLSLKVSGAAGGVTPELSEMGEAATLHGRELLEHGFTIDQVVHDYGDLCQAVTELAFERGTPIDIEEFKTLNRCLDNAIAEAVTEYSYGCEILAAAGERTVNERQGVFVHELRNLVNTASLAFTVLKTGRVGVAGASGSVLERTLEGLASLIERSIMDVRVKARMPARSKLLALDGLIAEARESASLEASARGCEFTVTHVDPTLAVDVDRELLLSAVGNLLTNAFKFTHRGTEVTLGAYAVADRILVEVSDNCGGLPVAFAQKMFLPFTQGSGDRSGLGLGLSISRRSVEANNGTLGVRDVPGTGCVFTIDLPRHALPVAAATAYAQPL